MSRQTKGGPVRMVIGGQEIKGVAAYATNYDGAGAEHPDGEERILCWSPSIVQVVNRYFAIRMEFHPHPAGEGMWVADHVLDHIPTGLKAFGGGLLAPATREQAELAAAGLSSAPVDWSISDRDELERILTSPAISGFGKIVIHRSRSNQPTSWGQWSKDSLDTTDDRG